MAHPKNKQFDDFYEAKIEPHLKKIKRLSKRGLSKPQIARRLGIAPATFHRHYLARAEVREAFMSGIVDNSDRVAVSLVKAATGYYYEETDIIEDEFGDVIQVKKKKKWQPPNPGAAVRVMNMVERYYGVNERAKEAQIRNITADAAIKEKALEELEGKDGAIPLLEILAGVRTVDNNE